MPATRLSSQQVEIRRSDVVGQDGGTAHFVGHVALAAENYSAVKVGTKVHVNHMGPPLERDGEVEVHTCGTAELDDDELNQIELFVDEHFNEQRAEIKRGYDQYVIHPHAAYSDDMSFRRFSCAGYVLEAYADAGISLIDLIASLPDVDLGTLFMAYPSLERVENNSALRQRLGLSRQDCGLNGDGPWPVLLPAYIFHSMERDVGAIRTQSYRVRKGDELFPREDY